MTIGANIKKRRFELKMSQQELADALGYKTRSTIAKIESGENDVSHSKLKRFAEALDISVEELISGYSALPTAPMTLKHEGENKNIAVILAGGKSGRNSQNIPSQFINVKGKPVIIYCMEVYEAHPLIDDIYVVCLKGWENIVKAYAEQYRITKLKGLIPAGVSGIKSLKNAVDCLMPVYDENDLLIVQESTRPLVTAETVSRLIQSSLEVGSGTICHAMKEYVQFDISGERPQYVKRDNIIALQSPEAHRFKIFGSAFERAERQGMPLNESCFTMLLHKLGFEINFIESNINNIKLTREEDIAAFGAIVKENY